jgi:putative molybdopterin biosynthesis protein
LSNSLPESADLSLQNLGADEALDRFLSELQFLMSLQRIEAEEVPVTRSLRRITASPVLARMSSPHFYSAAVDGLAVRSASSFSATPEAPARLELGCDGIFVETGFALPAGMDSIIPVHELQWVNPEILQVAQPSNPWRNIRPTGDDVVQNEVILPRDHRIGPSEIGAMAAAGVETVGVYRRPRVAVIPLGNHLVAAGVRPEVGETVDTNSQALAGLLVESECAPVLYPITPERLETASPQLEKAVAECDLVLVVAGPSHGTPLIAQLLCDLGDKILHGVSLKPCQTLALGVVSSRPVLGFPFLPLGVFAAFEAFVRPLLAELLGPSVGPDRVPRVKANLAVKLRRPAGSPEELVRVKLARVDDRVVAVPESGGASTVMSLVRSSGLMRVPADIEEVPERTNVSVTLFDSHRPLDGNILLVGTHDICCELLRSHLLKAFPEQALHTAATGGMSGLKSVRSGLAHLAAIHLFDEQTGTYNIPFVEAHNCPEPMVLINLCSRDLGLIVAPGNPLKIEGLADLARPEVRFINRQVGSGTRVLLDFYLRKAGIDANAVKGFGRELKTHMAVAAAVSSQAVDCGPGISTAARSLHLDFIPCIPERLDLAIPRRLLNRDPVAGLIEVVRSRAFQDDARSQLADYDFSRTGQQIWECNPA